MSGQITEITIYEFKESNLKKEIGEFDSEREFKKIEPKFNNVDSFITFTPRYYS